MKFDKFVWNEFEHWSEVTMARRAKYKEVFCNLSGRAIFKRLMYITRLDPLDLLVEKKMLGYEDQEVKQIKNKTKNNSSSNEKDESENNKDRIVMYR